MTNCVNSLETAAAKEIDENGSLALQCGPGRPASVKCRVATEGECADADGIAIHVLFHVKDGMMHELEVFKDDGSPTLESTCSPEPGSIYAVW